MYSVSPAAMERIESELLDLSDRELFDLLPPKSQDAISRDFITSLDIDDVEFFVMSLLDIEDGQDRDTALSSIRRRWDQHLESLDLLGGCSHRQQITDAYFEQHAGEYDDCDD